MEGAARPALCFFSSSQPMRSGTSANSVALHPDAASTANSSDVYNPRSNPFPASAFLFIAAFILEKLDGRGGAGAEGAA
jgi:hypothetical protein